MSCSNYWQPGLRETKKGKSAIFSHFIAFFSKRLRQEIVFQKASMFWKEHRETFNLSYQFLRNHFRYELGHKRRNRKCPLFPLWGSLQYDRPSYFYSPYQVALFSCHFCSRWTNYCLDFCLRIYLNRKRMKDMPCKGYETWGGNVYLINGLLINNSVLFSIEAKTRSIQNQRIRLRSQKAVFERESFKKW